MYKKIDNVLGSSVLSEIEHRVLDKRIPWYFEESTAYNEKDSNLFDFSFSHLIVNNSEPVSLLYDVMLMTFMQCLDKVNQKVDQLYRMRLGLITPTQSTFVHSAHIDSETPHITGLFYFNDSDGDTILYNNVFNPDSGMLGSDYVKTQELSVLEKFKPTKNTFVCFDGFRYHSSSTPTLSKKRVVLNVNYSIIK